MRAIQVQEFGDPSVLKVTEVDDPIPAANQVAVDVLFAGVNFRDLNLRSGLRGGNLPFIPGSDGVGTISALGPSVEGYAIGERVAWKAAPASYAEKVVVDERQLVRVPESISDEVAAAALLQGLTAHYLAGSICPIDGERFVLVHAAAGGVGLLLTQMLHIQGGKVIATVSSAEKERMARDAGAEEVIRYDSVDFAGAVAELTHNQGVPTIFDGIGQATFEGDITCLSPRGHLVLYGTASGEVPPFKLARLGAKSLVISSPSLPNYTATREELDSRSAEMFSWIESGRVSVHIGDIYPLDQASAAHELLQSRRSTGKLLLRV